jgi:hypothetical protein
LDTGFELGPVPAPTVRLALVVAVGAWLVNHDAEAWQYFALVAAAMLVYGIGTALAVRVTPRAAAQRSP